jgi:superfamily II DNA or RNA helicase
MNLRPYQQRCVDAVEAGWERFQRQLLVAATGAGKTIMFSHLAQRQSGQTLILAHRDELLEQAAQKLHAATGIIASIERGGQSALPSHSCVVASVQTMRRRLKKWQPAQFELIICDEAHHSLSPEWQQVLSYFTQCPRILGVTATPDRGDKKQLGGFYQNVAAEINLLDLVRDNYLAPMLCQRLEVELTLSSLKGRKEWSAQDGGDAISPRLEALAAATAEKIWDRKTMVFLPLCSTSEAFAAALCRHGIEARHVDGYDDDRRQDVKRWFAASGPGTAVCNAMLWTEGYDNPSIDCIAPYRPMKSRALYAQCIGRGTRLHPGKDHLLILDPLWLTADHNLCRPADIFTGSALHRDALQAQLDLGMDLLEAEEAAEKTVAESLERQLREAQKKKAPKGLVDPLIYCLSIRDGDLADWQPTMDWHNEPVPDDVRKTLEACNLWADGENTCHGYAAALLERVADRKALGLASPKQVMLLKKLGHANPELATSAQAGFWLGNKLKR